LILNKELNPAIHYNLLLFKEKVKGFPPETSGLSGLWQQFSEETLVIRRKKRAKARKLQHKPWLCGFFNPIKKESRKLRALAP